MRTIKADKESLMRVCILEAAFKAVIQAAFKAVIQAGFISCS